MSPEGDVVIGDETIDGLGTKQYFLSLLLGALVRIVYPSTRPPAISSPQLATFDADDSFPAPLHPSFSEDDDGLPPAIPAPANGTLWAKTHSVLTEYLPAPGYFVAGGAAGIISRTATAPLDRLKVYLIAQTGVARDAVVAARSGAAVEAARKAWRPLVDATKELWRAGGIRSLFAGKNCNQGAVLSFMTDLSGNGLNVVKVMPESAIKFGSYEVSCDSQSCFAWYGYSH